MAARTLKIEPEYRALHRIADNLAPQLRHDFLQAIKELRDKVSMDRLLQILARGDAAELGAFWQSYDQELAGAVRPAIRETLLRAAEAARIRNNVSTSFDLTNPKALELINTQTANLVQGVTEESRNAIREVIRQGFLGNADVPEMARRIRESIGLTQTYATAVENYRRGQIAAGVNDATAESRASRYAAQLLNLRATNIARTETIRAANLGQQAIWEQARQEGLMPPEQRRIWIVTPDDRLCPICEAIPPANPDGVAIGEPFKSPDLGAVMNPPAHPSCRCATALELPE